MNARIWSLLATLGCMSAEAPMEQSAPAPKRERAADEAYEPEATGGMAPGAPMPASASVVMLKEEAPADGYDRADTLADKKPAPEAATTRAWFPETFLFEPLVVTDAEGRASVNARVPDRLTSWRVLGLASSRVGGLAGATTSFLGTLPVYVDPVVPPFLMAGDSVSLPVQVVNTTGDARTTTLTVSVAGAATGAGGGRVTLPPGGSAVVNVPVTARQAGLARVRAVLEGADAIEREIEVKPTGQPVEVTAGGTLASPRTVSLAGPADAERESARVRLVVYPGALALLRAELAGALDGGGASEDAYALLLSGQGPGLLKALGEEPDAEALRKTGLLATQRALRHTLAPDVATAALFAEAALAHPDNPVLSRLAERLLDTLAAQQRPDGTFGGADGWTLQRLLVATADAVTAVRAGADRSPAARQRAARVSLRAGAAFERFAPQVQDPCTAAAVLVSGGAPERLAETLRGRVREAVLAREDGARVLPAPDGALRADGAYFSETECTALAALALQGDASAPWVPDLGAALLGAWRPGLGWGDGRADLLALRAVLALFREPVPEGVTVRLSMDGRTVLEGRLEGDRRKELVVLEAPAPDLAGAHTWTVEASPAVPGLGYQLALRTWVPWKERAGPSGGTLALDLPDQLRRGEAAELGVSAMAPAGEPLRIELGLPAGLVVDTDALERLKAEGRLLAYEAEDGRLTLDLPALLPGVPAQIGVRVIPTLSGTLRGGASSLRLSRRATEAAAIADAPPLAWRVQ